MDKRLAWLGEKLAEGLGVTPELYEQTLEEDANLIQIHKFLDGGEQTS